MPRRRKRVAAPAAPTRSLLAGRGRALLACASLALLTFLAYSNSFTAGFILDNKGALLGDPRIRELTSENLLLIFRHTSLWPNGEAGLYRPVTTLSYLFNYAVLGNAQQAAGYHAINLLLHLANVFLVYALARRLLQEFWPPFFTAALWAVHPALTESVTNMIGRSDLLAALAILSGFLMYLRSTESNGWRKAAWLGGLTAVTTLGVFSKESAVIIVGVIALYEFTWWRERKPVRNLLLGCAATLAPIAVMLYQRFRVLEASLPAEFPFTDNPITGAGFWQGRVTALQVIARYLGLMIWPAHLSSDYSYAQIPLAHGASQYWVVGMGALAVALLVAALYRRNRTAFFLLCFSGIALSPTANLLFPIGTIMADRFLYVPAIGLVACLVMAVDAAGKHVPVKHFAPVALGVIAIVGAIRTWVRNADWHDQLSMAEASVQTSPNSFKVHRLLAATLRENAPPGASLDRPIAEAERAVAILDALPDSLNTREPYRLAGGFHLAKGDAWRERNPALSVEEYRRALQLLQRSTAIDKSRREQYERKGGAEWARRHPGMAGATRGDLDAPWMLAAAYWRLGQAPEATAAAKEALTFHSTEPEAYRQISSIFAGQGQIELAATALIEGGLITSDMNFKADLVDLFRRAPDQGCALILGPGGPALNPACEEVHKPLCAAYIEAIKADLENNRWEAAGQHREELTQTYGCPAGPLDQERPK